MKNLIGLILGITVTIAALLQCGSDKKTPAADLTPIGATGSCTGEQSFGEGDAALKIDVCIDYSGWMEQTEGEVKKECLAESKEGYVSGVGSWKSSKCSSSGATAQCTGMVNPHGGTANYYTYNALFNDTVKTHLCTSATKGTYKENVSGVKVKAIATVVALEKTRMCLQYEDILQSQADKVKSTYPGTFKQNESCPTEGVMFVCAEVPYHGGNMSTYMMLKVSKEVVKASGRIPPQPLGPTTTNSFPNQDSTGLYFRATSRSPIACNDIVAAYRAEEVDFLQRIR